jgi:hypothetical protein
MGSFGLAASAAVAGGPSQMLLGVLPNAAWAAFFAGFALAGPRLLRGLAVVTLLAGTGPSALYLALSRPLGLEWISFLARCGLTLGWAFLLIAIAFDLQKRWLETAASIMWPLAAFRCIEALSVINPMILVNGVLWKYDVADTLWRQILRPGILVFYSIAQTLFLRALSGK